MPNVITARPPRILVGADLLEFSVSNFNWVTGAEALSEDGVIIKTATATLGRVASGYLPESLDPEVNPSRWRPRQPVRFQVRNSAGSWVTHPHGYLLMLTEPEYDPDTGYLTLDLGDWLAWGNLNDDPPGENMVDTQMGESLDYSEWCYRYLIAAGIPAANISIGGPWGYSKNVPDTKPGNPVGKAGEYAYSANYRVIYQNRWGVINSRPVQTSLNAVPDLIVDMRVSGLKAKRVQGGEEPVEVVRVSGTGRQAVRTDSNITDIVSEQDFWTYEQQKYSFGGAVIGRGGYFPMSRGARRVTRFWSRLPGEKVFDQGGSSIKVTTSDKTTIRYYEPYPGVAGFPYRMYYQFTYEERARGLSEGTDSPIPERFREIAVNYDFDSDGRVKKIVETVWGREKEFIKDGSIQFRRIKEKTQTWTKEGTGLYAYKEVEKVARINTSDYDGRFFGRWDLVIDKPPESRPAAGKGKNEPPAPEEWEGPYSPEDSDYEGEAYWQHRGGYVGNDRTRGYTLPDGLAVSDAQCVIIAIIHRDLLDGRKRGRVLQLPITDELLAIDFPLFQARITLSDSETYTYLVDSLNWEHQPDSAFVAGFGILLGQVKVPKRAVLRGGLIAGGRATTIGAQGVDVRGGLVMGGRAVFQQVIEIGGMRGGLVMGGRATSGVPRDADAEAFTNRLTGSYSSAQIDAIDQFVVALKGRTLVAGGSQWDSLHGLWIRAALTEADSRLNMKGPDYTLVDNGGPTHTPGVGVQYSTLSHSDTGLVANAISTSLDGVVGAWNIEAGSYSQYQPGMLMGARSGNSNTQIYLFDSPSKVSHNLNGSQRVDGVSSRGGAFTVTRNASEVSLVKDAALAASGALATTSSATDYSTLLNASNDTGSVWLPGVSNLKAAWQGAGIGWTAAEAVDFHADLQVLLDALAVPSPDPDAQAYIARLGGSYSSAQTDAIDQFVKALKGRSITAGGNQWDSLHGLWIRAALTEADSRLNMKGTDYTLVDDGGPVHTPGVGMKYNKAQYSDTGLVANTISTNIDGVIGAYHISAGSYNQYEPGILIGALSSDGGALRIYLHGNIPDLSYGVNGPALQNGISSPGGAFTASRRNVSNGGPMIAVHDQTLVASYSSYTIQAAGGASTYLGALNNGGPVIKSLANLKAAWQGAGAGWTDAEAMAFHADLQVLLDALAPPGPDLTENLTAWWSLDESSDGSGSVNRIDSYSGGHTLTDHNTVKSAAGKAGNAADFVASDNEYLSSTAAAFDFSGGPGFYVAGWFYPRSANGTLICKSNSSDGEMAFQVFFSSFNYNVLRLFVTSNGSSFTLVTSPGFLSLNTWMFFEAYWDAANNEIGIAVNKSAFTTQSFTGDLFSSPQPLTLGAEPFGGITTSHFDGLLDEVAVYSAVPSDLSETSAFREALYSDGNGIGYPG